MTMFVNCIIWLLQRFFWSSSDCSSQRRQFCVPLCHGNILANFVPNSTQFARTPILQTQGKPLSSGGGGDLAAEVAALKKLLHDVGISSMTEMRRGQMCSWSIINDTSRIARQRRTCQRSWMQGRMERGPVWFCTFFFLLFPVIYSYWCHIMQVRHQNLSNNYIHLQK